MNPTSAQHAALRILLEDVEPLLQQAEELASTLKAAREELHVDLETLGGLVQRSVDAQPALLEAGRKLSGSAARIEASLTAADVGRDELLQRSPLLATAWVASASSTICAVLMSAVFYFVGGDIVEQARIGRALQSAWSSLDTATRSRIRDVISK